MTYNTITDERIPIRLWNSKAVFDDATITQLRYTAQVPIVGPYIAAMPDSHKGTGAVVGSVIPTIKGIIPAAVGVDLGCGMSAVKTSLVSDDLDERILKKIYDTILERIPCGRTDNGGGGDIGAWHGPLPDPVKEAWEVLGPEYEKITEKHPRSKAKNTVGHLGTLGTGNHFLEICEDQNRGIWLVLHSGSRGPGNRIGTYFTELAKKDMGVHIKDLPDRNLAYLNEGTEYFDDYIAAVWWAQEFASVNRSLMMENFIRSVRKNIAFSVTEQKISCHHNYVSTENFYGQELWITRKGAIRAGFGEMGIIPGSMGDKSYIVSGLGNNDSFCSSSHGAGRQMGRREARNRFTTKDLVKQTEGVVCNKTKAVLDEIPGAYKPIDDVMESQKDLTNPIYTLKQLLNVKGESDDDE